MNYSKIIKFDTGNSHGISTTLFVSGCANQCPLCHNQQTWDPLYGKEFSDETLTEILKSLNNPHVKNFVLSGGDPLYYENVDFVNKIVYNVKEVFGEDKKIILYTGMTVENILGFDNRVNRVRKSIINKIDYLIDGCFDYKKKTKGLDLRGSYNQQCYSSISSNENCLLTNISLEYFREKYDNDLVNYTKIFTFNLNFKE